MSARRRPDHPNGDSLAKEIRDGLAEEAKSWLLWALAGAIVGAVLLGGIGAYFAGLKGLGIGALAGAALGGIGVGIIYLQA
ncbi:MAG: hypothetical protein ACYTHK_06770 [Planctomycetota bacterium]|jgi:hypothetical protein